MCDNIKIVIGSWGSYNECKWGHYQGHSTTVLDKIDKKTR